MGSTYTVGLPEVPALAADMAPGGRNTVLETLSDSGEFRITFYTVIVENLRIGTRYWLRVVPRNANIAAYTQSPPSNVMELMMAGAPPPVLNLKASLVKACMQVSCGCWCCGNGGTNTCDGLADVTIQWNNPTGAFTISSFQISAFLGGALEWEQEVLPTQAIFGDRSYTLGAQGESIAQALTEKHTIPGLKMHRTYTVRVTARNANVEGYRYPASLEVTPADLPSVSVEDTLKVTHVTATDLSLQWRPVTSQPVTFYKVDLDVNPAFPSLGPDTFYGEFEHEASADPAYRMQVTVKGLTPGLPYYLLVTPRNLNPGADGADAFVQGYRPCPLSVEDLVVTEIQPAAAFPSYLAYRLTWRAPASTKPILRYRIWHASTPGGVGALASYQRLADFDASEQGTMQHEVDGFVAGDSPHAFLVTPIASHCALLGPIVPRTIEPLAHDASVVSVTVDSILLRWRSPGCPDACLGVSAFLITVARCTTTASVHAHAGSMRDCAPAEEGEMTTVSIEACDLEGWCEHRVESLTRQAPVRIVLQALLQGFQEPEGNVTLVAVPTGRAEHAPSHLTLTSRTNSANHPAGASVALSWQAPTLAAADPPVDRFKVAYWLASERSCFGSLPLPCFSYAETPPLLHTTTGNVTGLRPDVTYAFRVFAGNLNGFEGEGSDALTPVRTSHMPGPVEHLSVVASGTTSLVLSWVNPSQPTPRKLLIEWTDLDCAREEGAAGASAAAVSSACTVTYEETCSLGRCAAAPRICSGGSSANQRCTLDSDCGGGTCVGNNKGTACQDGGQCSGGAECVQSCPSHYEISHLRPGRPLDITVTTAGEVDSFFQPCTAAPNECPELVKTGKSLITARPLEPPLPVVDLHVRSMTETTVELGWNLQEQSPERALPSHLILRGRRKLGLAVGRSPSPSFLLLFFIFISAWL